MCGIVGYVGTGISNLPNHLVDLLATLEYRGYDSAGVTTLSSKQSWATIKAVGGLSKLRERLSESSVSSHLGVAHTRWATHGVPSERNAHPIVSPNGKAAIIFNGIVENHLHLRRLMSQEGIKFQTDNDAETLLQWILHYYQGNLGRAVDDALANVHGRFAFSIVHVDHPELLVAIRKGNPLLIGVSKNGHYIASDVLAIQNQVEQIHYLEDHSIAEISPCGFVLRDFNGASQSPRLQPVPETESIHLNQKFETFTLQEIYSQPSTVALATNIAKSINKDFQTLERHIHRVVLIGCGSAYYACLAGASLIQKHARIPAVAVIASEFRVSFPILDPNTLVITVSQSGETSDTLSCLELAKHYEVPTMAICNVMTSSMARAADFLVPIGSGPEIGVASTKAFTGMLIQIVFLALGFGVARSYLTHEMWEDHCDAAAMLPKQIHSILTRHTELEKMAKTLRERKNFLFVGRDVCLPIAYEGALKLRELSYRHAEGIGAGELKHGTLALIESQYPVIAIAPKSDHSAKMINSIQEMKARGAQVWAITTEGDHETQSICHHSFAVPETLPAFTPLMATIPLQLFAYEFAKTLGRNIDRPRNLAKSVTVE